MDSGEKCENKGQIEKRSQERGRGLQVIEKEDQQDSHDLTDCACLSQHGRREVFLSSDQQDDEEAQGYDHISSDDDKRYPERDKVGVAQRGDRQQDEGGGKQEFICGRI